MAKLLHFFLNVDMRQNHRGLIEFLKTRKVKITDEDFIVFMNSRRSMLKMLCKGKDALLHYKSPSGCIDPGMIRYLPKYCDGKEMNVDGAIGEHLTDVIKRKVIVRKAVKK